MNMIERRNVSVCGRSPFKKWRVSTSPEEKNQHLYEWAYDCRMVYIDNKMITPESSHDATTPTAKLVEFIDSDLLQISTFTRCCFTLMFPLSPLIVLSLW